MIYCLFWPLTAIDLVPDVMVGALLQPGERPLTTCLGPLRLAANEGLESPGKHCPNSATVLSKHDVRRKFVEIISIKVKPALRSATKW